VSAAANRYSTTDEPLSRLASSSSRVHECVRGSGALYVGLLGDPCSPFGVTDNRHFARTEAQL